jgi:hypothetical protein
VHRCANGAFSVASLRIPPKIPQIAGNSLTFAGVEVMPGASHQPAMQNPIERTMDDSSSRRFCGSAIDSDARDAQAGNRAGMTVLFG